MDIFLTKKKTLKCSSCGKGISLGEAFVAESEKHKGTCFACSPYVHASFLKSGDAALTRRSKKHSAFCGVLYEWNARRKRFQRKGQYVETEAIVKAKLECQADQAERKLKNERAAIKRVEQDQQYIAAFARSIRSRYPNCPKGRELIIAQHACEKHSGRIGRTAKAKEFDEKMIDLAVEAHIRHAETNYDDQFGSGKTKRMIRTDVKPYVVSTMRKWL